MNKKNIFSVILFLLITPFLFGQIDSRKIIYGVIVVENITGESINVVNQSLKLSTVSDKNGLFSILAKEGDVLVFSAVNLDTLHKIIIKHDLVLDVIRITMTPASIALKEVVVKERQKISAESLGIIPNGMKKYTSAERKLKTAGDFKPIMLLGLIGGSMPLDPLINMINGRTKRLKKDLEVERKEFCLKKLENMFDEDHIINKLGIPAIYVKGFEYFAVENENFIKNLNLGNKTVIEFLLGELAVKYKSIIANE
ncbi:carboxypeptidase-like regulatory domain-containing protein [Flavobacterium sp. K5-23]|uniref:carboxypeptidase-like regulatory domain-containing protein n=1 Tax=Flavobacterium sp. K5-23 TaxID=2746225 RepID=UPI00200EFA00|nr:carboxypeptidase-like regulatory domain-containing protein [Flavobacterium sp. K5-23]UQD55079.1 hypothetical protein FLAK523_01215 [Flavobacterium sp. K5-23]